MTRGNIICPRLVGSRGQSTHGRERAGVKFEHDCCPECGYNGEPKTHDSYEFADADGNRGIMVTWVECPKCGWEG